MGVEVYPLNLEHPQHGKKTALTRREADLDKRNGWVEVQPPLGRYPNKLTTMLNRARYKRSRVHEKG